jgi:hypothetical protein
MGVGFVAREFFTADLKETSEQRMLAPRCSF